MGIDEGIEKDYVLDLLSRLVDKSLVVAEAEEEGEEAPRYRMLEPVRQYGREKLEESGEADVVQRRHATFFLALVEEAEPELMGARQAAWLRRLEAEHDNLRAALSWALDRREAELGLRLGGALGWFWHMRGYLEEGLQVLEAALADSGPPASARVKALVHAGYIAWERVDYERSRAFSEEALGLARELGDTAGVAAALSNLGSVALFQNEHEKASALIEEAVALRRALGDTAGLAWALQLLGLVEVARHDFERAAALYEEGLPLARGVGDELGVTLLLGLGALAFLGLGDHGRARDLCAEGMELSRRLGHPHAISFLLNVLASAAGSQGQSVRSARLWGAAEALREAIGIEELSLVERHHYGPYIAAAREGLDEADWEAAWAEGKAMTREAAIEYALSEEEPIPPTAPTPEHSPAPLPQTGKHNLPAARTSFIGRERELVEVKRQLPMTRLLTLTGAGGSGKTRLALKVAKDLVEAYPDGVWLVELAGLSEGEMVPQAVADTLKVRERPGQPLIDTLVEALREKKILLVVDNCEHLINAVARLVDTLLNGCPHLRVLATSREALAVAGEINWWVPPLSLPNPRQPLTVEGLGGYESARLFVERARYREPAFALSPGNILAVAEICQQLEGIPLAMELAAALVGALAVEQIAARLKDSLRLLTGGGRTAVSRQQTLRGTLDWSFELLGEPEKRLFGRLSVFRGGWTLEAAEAVGAGYGIRGEDMVNLLLRLVDKSLVVEAWEEKAPRYRMLEPVRQYGRERLEKSGEAEVILRRHAAFFLALAEEAEPE